MNHIYSTNLNVHARAFDAIEAFEHGDIHTLLLGLTPRGVTDGAVFIRLSVDLDALMELRDTLARHIEVQAVVDGGRAA